MRNEYFFQIAVLDEQIAFANTLVDYSIAHHPVKDIFSRDPDGSRRQREFRLTGTLGEIVFADAYHLSRPSRSFGAVDGQDFGQDFVVEIDGVPKSFDIKTMQRKNNRFRANYVLNLPAYQMRRQDVVTDYYFCVNLHTAANGKYVASFLGFVAKNDIESGEIGILYPRGTRRVKDNADSFLFMRDTYEVDFKDITSPILSDRIRQMPGFEQMRLL